MAGQTEIDAARFGLDLLKTVVDDYRREQKEQSRLINDASRHVKQLDEDMSVLRRFLKDSIKRSKNEILNMSTLLKDVRNSLYDAEDTVDALLIHAAGGASNKSKLSRIAQDVESHSTKIKQVLDQIDEQIKSDAKTGGKLGECGVRYSIYLIFVFGFSILMQFPGFI